MFVIQLDDSPRYPTVYFSGFSEHSVCPVKFGCIEFAERFDDLSEVIAVQRRIHTLLPQSRWIVTLGG